MTPADFGYVKCIRCKCQRPRGFAIGIGAVGSGPLLFECSDQAWCDGAGGAESPHRAKLMLTGTSAEVALAGLDVNGDALPVTP